MSVACATAFRVRGRAAADCVRIVLDFGARSEGVRRSNLGFILAIGYLAVFGVAECLTLYDLVFHTAQSEFSGLWIIVVGLPWSLMLSPVWSAVGYVDWYQPVRRHAAGLWSAGVGAGAAWRGSECGDCVLDRESAWKGRRTEGRVMGPHSGCVLSPVSESRLGAPGESITKTGNSSQIFTTKSTGGGGRGWPALLSSRGEGRENRTPRGGGIFHLQVQRTWKLQTSIARPSHCAPGRGNNLQRRTPCS